jgi:hypothetical protein
MNVADVSETVLSHLEWQELELHNAISVIQANLDIIPQTKKESKWTSFCAVEYF